MHAAGISETAPSRPGRGEDERSLDAGPPNDVPTGAAHSRGQSVSHAGTS